MEHRRGWDRRALAGCLGILALGVVPRLLFALAFPTQPISDFRAVHDFAVAFRDQPPLAPGEHWRNFNPGAPMLLAPVLALFPDATIAAARLATAIATGCLPLLPWILWRNTYSMRVRLLAALGLALWPGQILFSGVVAQDNWVLLPSVALAALAARPARPESVGLRPLAAGLIYGAAVAIRSEMLVVLLPLLAPAAGVWPAGPRRVRRALLVTATAALVLAALVGQRAAATGRAAITPENARLAILGTFAPGPLIHGWNDPLPEVAAREPALLRDPRRLRRSALRLALERAAERPGFHALARTATALYLLRTATASSLVWSIGVPEVLPIERQAAGAALLPWAWRGLVVELVLLQGLFLASLWLAPRHAPPAVWWLTAAILLKIGIHTVAGAQGRSLLPAFAWQILVIALAADGWRGARRRAAAGLAGGAAVAAGLALGAPWLMRRAEAGANEAQRVYEFPLVSPDGRVALDCVMREGRLTLLEGSRAAIAPRHADPGPGDSASADCRIERAGETLRLRIADRHAPGGFPDHLEQRVELGGRTVWRRDLAAEPGTGWAPLELAPGAAGSIRIVVAVLRPPPSPGWGDSATTEFVLEPAASAR